MKSIKTQYQTIAIGINALPQVLEDIRASKVLLVVDSSFPFLSIKSDVESMGVPYIVFDQFTPNPLYEDVCKGVDLFRAEQCDAIVAVGGGSSIDVAKCIKLYCKMSGTQNYLQQDTFDSHIPLIAIPTTAGTGSESTRFAVIYFEGKKQSVNHLSIIPTYAILEPQVLTTLPRYQKVCTALDALCQGIESWWSVNSTQESQLLSRMAVKSLWTNIMAYVEGADSPEHDLQLSWAIMYAANQAGQAINLTQTTAPHAFSYKLTSLYGIPHGHAVAVCLPYIWRYMVDHPDQCIDTRGQDYLSDTFLHIANALGEHDVEKAISAFSTLLIMLGVKYPQSAHRQADLDVLCHSVNPVRLKNNPVALDDEAISHLYQCIVPVESYHNKLIHTINDIKQQA